MATGFWNRRPLERPIGLQHDAEGPIREGNTGISLGLDPGDQALMADFPIRRRRRLRLAVDDVSVILLYQIQEGHLSGISA